MTSYSHAYEMLLLLSPHSAKMDSVESCVAKDIETLREHGATIQAFPADFSIPRPHYLEERFRLSPKFSAKAVFSDGLEIFIADAGWWLVADNQFCTSNPGGEICNIRDGLSGDTH